MTRLDMALVAFAVVTTGCSAAAPAAKQGAVAERRAAPERIGSPSSVAPADAPRTTPPPPTFPAIDPAADAAAAARSLVLHFMPERCDEARLYMSAEQILGSDLRTPVEAVSSGLLALSFAGPRPPPTPPPGPAPSWGASQQFAQLGRSLQHAIDVLQLGFSTREIAVCSNRDDRSDVVALALDMTGWGDPTETLARALRSKTGKAPLRRVRDGVPYLAASPDRGWYAVLGTDRLVVAATVDAASAAVTRAATTDKVDDGFARAGGSVVWLGRAAGILEVRPAEGGYAARDTRVEDDERARARAKKLQAQRGEFGRAFRRTRLLAPFAAALDHAAISVEGDATHVTTTIAADAMVRFVREVERVPSEHAVLELLESLASTDGG